MNTKIKMFATWYKAKPAAENMRSLNLEVVRLTIVDETKLLL
jgi:hypothetical protein